MRKTMMIFMLMLGSLISMNTYSQTDLVATFRSISIDGEFDNFGEWEKEELLISFSENKIKIWTKTPITIFLKDIVENTEGEDMNNVVYKAVDNLSDKCIVIMSFAGKNLNLYIVYDNFAIKYYINNI